MLWADLTAPVVTVELLNGVVGASATIIAALIAFIGVMLTLNHRQARRAAIASEGARATSHAAAAITEVVREQVQNTHTTNLRDDMDKIVGLVEGVLETQHAVITEQKAQKHAIGVVIATQAEHTKDIGGLRADVRGVRTDQSADREAVRELEKRATRHDTPSKGTT